MRENQLGDPWPDRIYLRIILMPDGCWQFERLWHQKQANAQWENAKDITKIPVTGEQRTTRSIVWELVTGSDAPRIRDPQQLFAVCGNVRCLNPEHMILCTPQERSRYLVEQARGYDPQLQCSNGHVGKRYRLPSGKLRCRSCEREQKARWRERNPEKVRAADLRRLAQRPARSAFDAQLALDELRFGPLQPDE